MKRYREQQMIVKKLRLQRGWSQEQLAELAGVTPRTIQRIERGQNPSLETARALASVFEVDQSTFTDGDLTMESSTTTGVPSVTLEERMAMDYVKNLKEFYNHLLIYAVMSIVYLGFFDLPRIFVFFWLGWTVGVVIHGLKAYEVIGLMNPQWEKRMIEKRLGRKL
ncbi:MAG TPA: helix-turn-helix domain-containing protein [Cellvibrionaceae bacterium]